METVIPGPPLRRGKVRDVYDLGDYLLLVATDRISAYDVVMANGIPGKGEMLTRMSKFWFDGFADTVPNHVESLIEEAPPELRPYASQLRGRAMLCRKLKMVPIECVVRGYLAGSGWRDYQETQSICGVPLPAGLKQCEQLPKPIFTPATKAEEGHDENITFEQACEIAGEKLMQKLRDLSLQVYQQGAEYARKRGIIIADTKLEWGLDGKEIVLADEVLTPDSSRFWPAGRYEPGRDQESFDKQYVRNYLTELVSRGEWDKKPPGPELPAEIVANTASKYRQAYRQLTGLA
ncbi:MAG: phosphoribosylaminoimidazolesuccinocarboxamide synthase [Phycisphaerales bacterium]|nr:MAG: phosphoribosylaminoimidazolesuccinocarboxamide synthase [Phycisphaerales bacterium]